MSKLLQKVVSIKDKKIRAEVVRAHVVIILLSLVLAFVLVFNSTDMVTFNGPLTVVAAALLAVVALLSLRIVLALGVGAKAAPARKK